MGQELDEALANAVSLIRTPESLVRVVLSGRRRNMQPAFERIDIRPVLIKEQLLLQVASNDGRQTLTRNLTSQEASSPALLDLLSSGYANILVEQTSGSMAIRITKKDVAMIHFEKSEHVQTLDHDRVKPRLLDASDPFLREVGIADVHGKIKPSRQDKYLQVEEFLRILAPTLKRAIDAGHIPTPTVQAPLTIADLGCGNAYLTFAAHQYLCNIGIPVHVTGIDVRESSRIRNSKIAEVLGINATIDFLAEEIATTTIARADVVIALHACDTATDDAIAWGIKNDARLLLIAPCCHHDLQSQLKESPEPWSLITRYGLMKERLADLLTDALRIQILKIRGYRTEAIEFIGGEHTPRNLMIRAVKTGANPEPEEIARYDEMVALWKVTPALNGKLNSST